MTAWNGFRGAARRLDDVDLPRIGHRIGVGEDEIHAFMDVEASGSGFDDKGRPKMLFEPHVFYRNLSGAKRDEAVRQKLAYPKWRAGNYPADSYPRLAAAMAIDETAALKAASWGLGQVLGDNHALVGYATPQAMVLAFMEDEEKHLEAMVAFLIARKIDDDLRAHRWSKVAEVYNGPGYRTHNYDGRMAAAFARWRRIKDTPWSPGNAEPVLVEPPAEPGPIDRAAMIREGQMLLIALGYDLGPAGADGLAGAKTKAATLAYQKRHPTLITDSKIGALTLAELRADVAASKPVAVPEPVPPPPPQPDNPGPAAAPDDDDYVLVDSDYRPLPDHPPAPETAGITGPVLVFAGIIVAIVAAVFIVSRIAG